MIHMTNRKIHFNAASGTIGYGSTYGEQSFNGEPVQSVPSEKASACLCYVPNTIQFKDCKMSIRQCRVMRKFAFAEEAE